MKTRILNLGWDCKLVIPESVSTKELQAFIGFIGTLRKASSLCNYEGTDFAYANKFASVQIEEVDLYPEEEAVRLSTASKEAYKAREAAAAAAE
jgi:hypothetical protein